MEVLLVSFATIFVCMMVLVAVQCLRQGELPTGCTPKGCARCRKDCPSKTERRAHSSAAEA